MRPNYGYRPPAPPRRRSPIKAILTGAVVVCLVALAGIVIVNFLRPGGVVGNYENESYTAPPVDKNPDAIPIPGSAAQSTEWMQRNPLYDQRTPASVRCDIGNIRPASASDAEAQKYLNDLTECLMRVWDNLVMQKAGFKLPRPSVTVYSTQITTKCGTAPTRNAFYCSGDQQLYFATDVLTILPPNLRNHRLALDAVLGHEFGHHMQGRSGILAGAHLTARALDERPGLVYMRRLEVQADCLNAQFLQAVGASRGITQSEKEDVAAMYYSIGDDVLSGKPEVWGGHGLGATRRTWAQKGFTTTQVSVCNSFTAPEPQVR